MQAKPLILCDDVLVAACQRGTVLVPNQRLKRHVLHSFNARQTELGASVWRSARVEVLDNWLAGRYRRLASRGHPAAKLPLLDESAQRLIWLANPPDNAPSNLNGLYPLVRHAWELLHAFQLQHRTDDLVDNENARLLRDWITRYRAAASDQWLSAAELCPLITDAASTLARELDGQLLLVGFETLTPAQQALLDALSTHGAQVERFAPAALAQPAEVAQLRCATAEVEIDQAIAWARDLLLQAGDTPLAIGIAVPDVVARYDAITRQLDTTLSPHVTREDPSSRAYNLSGGIVLADHPTVAAALGLLRWLLEPIPYGDAERLLTSPFLAFPTQALPAALTESFTFATFAHASGATGATGATGQASHRLLLNRLSSAPRRASLGDWAEHFDGWLRGAQWSERSASHSAQDTTTFQAANEFKNALDEMARLSPLGSVCAASEALALLDGLARQRLFAPKRPDAPLQVISHDEIDGLRFTHLWITGLSDRDWPGQSRTNPMLPLRLQREASIPRCDAASQYRYAREALQRWHHVAGQVVFSCATREGEEALRPTSLLPERAWSTHNTERNTDPLGHPFLVQRGLVLEGQPDDQGPPLDIDTLTSHSSSMLRDQAQCPFRAFAIARLGLRKVDPPHSFPDARERGTAVHEALHLAYQQISDRKTLRDMSETQQAALAESAASRASQDQLARFPERVQALEAIRITALLREWFVVDAARPDFEVVGTEVETEAEAGTLPLKLRIDRIDRTEDGLLVLDYKTGPCDVRGWSPSGFAEPQLPLYATLTNGVSGAAYASINPEHSRLLGISSDAQRYRGDRQRMLPSSHLDDGNCADWNELLDAWRIRLRDLADAFIEGQAAVQPIAKSSCEFCHLHALCRIDFQVYFPTDAQDDSS